MKEALKGTRVDGAMPLELRKRISREERERAIVAGAIKYFAEVGFSGQMRTLAERIGVSQALLFKHFITKDALIERVYEDVYLKRWNPAWESILEDKRLSVPERLIKFYDHYIEASSEYQWIRIFMFASLARHDINDRYLSLIRERIIPKLCKALREYASVPADTVFTETETQAAWGLHGSMLYYLLQLNIYANAHPDAKLVVRARVGAFIDGTFKRLNEQHAYEWLGDGIMTPPASDRH